jgi:serine O-acetyltransferase
MSAAREPERPALSPADEAAASWLAQRAGVEGGPCRRPLPDPLTVRAVARCWRNLVFPEIWTRERPTPAGLRAELARFRGGLEEVLAVERLSRPDKAGPAATGRPDEAEIAAAQRAARADADAVVAALPTLREALEDDLAAALAGDPAARSRAEIVLCYPGFRAMVAWRLANLLWRRGALLVARMLTERAHARSGIDLHPGATIAPGLFIDHGTGVVVGETAVIGRGVRLYQGVTVGARSLGRDVRPGKRHPTLEDGVVVYANATILGGDTCIGAGAVVGGNAWVTASVPAGTRLRMGDPDGPERGGPAG